MPGKLPSAAQKIAANHPQAWKAYEDFGTACAQAGPLDARRRCHVIERQSREFCATILLKRRPLRSSIGSSLGCETGVVSFGKSNDVGR
jgi:hypothetical protein